MKPGKAPQLAGTQMTEKQVHDRIRDGKTDAMGFRRTLTEEQLQAFTTYIKGLKRRSDAIPRGALLHVWLVSPSERGLLPLQASHPARGELCC